MKLLKSIFYLLVPMLLLSATSCQKDKYPDLGDGLFAEIVTSQGTMVAKLTPNRAPATVANFVALAEGVHPMVTENLKGKKFYNGLIFHRVMDQFMIQGGCPQGTGRGTPGYRFGDEFDDSLRHDKAGVLSMANSGPGGTNGSQFFILDDVPKPHLDDVHSIFGQIVLGDEVRDSISAVKVGANNKPIEDVVIQEVNIIRQGFDARQFDAVKVWNTELPKLDERRQKFEERQRQQAEEARKKAEELSKKAAEEIVESLKEYKSKASTAESGLMYHIIQKGEGEKPKQGNTVTVSYEGYFNDGKLFGSSSKELEQKFGIYSMRKEQRGFYGDLKMTLTPDMNMIPGFKEAVGMMSIGDRYFFYLPSHLAFGEQGAPPAIPPNTDIIYIIEMLAKIG